MTVEDPAAPTVTDACKYSKCQWIGAKNTMEIVAAFTGESLGIVESLDPDVVAAFLKLPSQWHLRIFDRNRVVFIEHKLAEALHEAHRWGKISEQFRDDKQVVLAAVRCYGDTLKDASENFRADREVVLAAVHQDGWALKYASKDLRADREVVLAAVKQYGVVLRYASEDLRADHDVALAAVHQNGWALQFVSADLRVNGDVMLAAREYRRNSALNFY
jgi:hypothetical protein